MYDMFFIFYNYELNWSFFVALIALLIKTFIGWKIIKINVKN